MQEQISALEAQRNTALVDEQGTRLQAPAQEHDSNHASTQVQVGLIFILIRLMAVRY